APGPQQCQLVEGEPRAMALASATHGAIQSELARVLGNHLLARSSPCRVITAPGIVPRVQARTNFRIPDLGVTCASYTAEDQALSEPVLLIEILSPSNWAETWSNVWTYTSIPSVQEILVLHSARVGAELLRRTLEGAWPERRRRWPVVASCRCPVSGSGYP
ncbi:MAG: Uma2 family endonuclease, partial [Gammaproteobacteria bacterium]|nr:Uma2 family endonuclease [Gammaproteobacteria bacterium]